jgi:hypothetical protein
MESKIFDLVPPELHEQLLKEAEQIINEKKQKEPEPIKLTKQELDKIIGKI